MHAVFYWLQITIGSHGGVDYRMDYRNVSLLDMASSPSNVFQDAVHGDAMAMWVISSTIVIIVSYCVSYRQFVLRRVQSAWNKFNIYINRHVVVMILLGFIWLCVARTSALSDESIRQRQSMLPDVAERLAPGWILDSSERTHSDCELHILW